MPFRPMHQFILLFTAACSSQAKDLPHQWTKLANGISLAPLLVVGLGLLSNLLHGGKVYKGRHLCKDSVIFQLVILINDHCDNFYVVQHSNVFQLMQQWQDSNAWPLVFSSKLNDLCTTNWRLYLDGLWQDSSTQVDKFVLSLSFAWVVEGGRW